MLQAQVKKGIAREQRRIRELLQERDVDRLVESAEVVSSKCNREDRNTPKQQVASPCGYDETIGQSKQHSILQGTGCAR